MVTTERDSKNIITLSALNEYLQIIREENMKSDMRTFILPDKIDFGFHPMTGRNALLFNNATEVQRKDPSNLPDDAVVYGSKPLTGTAEFEVEIMKHRRHIWGGTLRIGVMRCKAGCEIVQSRIPRESERAIDHCVWWDTRVYNRFDGNIDTRRYGLVDLYDLGEGDRVGMRLTLNGDLVFLVNGETQGIAALDVHKDGYEVYPVVDVCTRCYEVRITRAVMCFRNTLQELCVDRITRCLKSYEDIKHLPLSRQVSCNIELAMLNRIIQSIRPY